MVSATAMMRKESAVWYLKYLRFSFTTGCFVLGTMSEVSQSNIIPSLLPRIWPDALHIMHSHAQQDRLVASRNRRPFSASQPTTLVSSSNTKIIQEHPLFKSSLSFTR